MRIPFRVSRLKVRQTKAQYIIIHQTTCMYPQEAARIDNAKAQFKTLSKGVLEDKSPDINYHFVIERVGEEYIAITCRPFMTMCDFPDIEDSISNRAIHVALLGSYDFKIPEQRLYEVLCYRVINPLLKLFSLNPNRIKFHNEVSDIKDLQCPGDFLDKDKIIAMTRRYVLK